jgi:thiamine-phosphate pyrophosphorylase
MNISKENQQLTTTYRVIDANGNRAAEGLRVVEDYLRFSCQDTFLSKICKVLRHDLSQIMREFPLDKLLRSRSTLTDVGTTLGTDTEYERCTVLEIALANLHRAMEAMRTLEEYSKHVSSSIPHAFEALRYRLYTLEKSLVAAADARHLFQDATIYVLADLTYGSDDGFAKRIDQLVHADVDVIQLRDKQATDRELITAARRLRGCTRGTPTKMIVNDRPDIAALVGADGVHVGQQEMTIADARCIVGTELAIGVSTHSIEQARTAVLEGADYLGVGPVFSSKTKSFGTLAGLGLVREIAEDITLPSFAIGGIDLHNVAEVLAQGIRRVAVGASVWHADQPMQVVRQLREAIDHPSHLQLPPIA